MRLDIPDALSFFQRSCGRWRSQRSVHHLLHRRAEAGGSLIVVDDIASTDQRLHDLAVAHGQAPEAVVGGSYVRWSASMAWDQSEEGHDGETFFGLIPESDDGRSGLLLRTMGYAEKAPATSRFSMDSEDGLILETAYETMTVWERFSFLSPDIRVRSSTVQGLSNNASYCLECRVDATIDALAQVTPPTEPRAVASISALGW
ncbi:MAG: phycobiliprotein lyase [Synechococcus sp.]